jgi:hypothetical protein
MFSSREPPKAIQTKRAMFYVSRQRFCSRAAIHDFGGSHCPSWEIKAQDVRRKRMSGLKGSTKRTRNHRHHHHRWCRVETRKSLARSRSLSWKRFFDTRNRCRLAWQQANVKTSSLRGFFFPFVMGQNRCLPSLKSRLRLNLLLSKGRSVEGSFAQWCCQVSTFTRAPHERFPSGRVKSKLCRWQVDDKRETSKRVEKPCP